MNEPNGPELRRWHGLELHQWRDRAIAAEARVAELEAKVAKLLTYAPKPCRRGDYPSDECVTFGRRTMNVHSAVTPFASDKQFYVLVSDLREFAKENVQ